MKRLFQHGYTLVELLVVMVLFFTLAGFITTNLSTTQHNVSLATAYSTLLTDVRSQQIKAMTGDTGGGSSKEYYGIHFATSSYTLFQGSTYTPGDLTNLTIQLNPIFQFTSIHLPNSDNDLIFIPINGEIYGYSSVANSVTLLDTVSRQQKTLDFNYLGIITTD